MMITAHGKSVIPFRSGDARRVGKECYYLDLIVWLNGEFIELGDGVGFNYACYVNGFGGLTIGDNTMFGPSAMVHTANHETDPDKPLKEQGHIKQPISIGKETWIGMGAIILPGVTIGDGVIVGAGSVVTENIPPHALVYGNPAKIKGFVCRCGRKLVTIKKLKQHIFMVCQVCNEKYKIKSDDYKKLKMSE